MNIHKKNIVNDSRIKILHKKTTVKQRHQENIDNEGVKKSNRIIIYKKKKGLLIPMYMKKTRKACSSHKRLEKGTYFMFKKD